MWRLLSFLLAVALDILALQQLLADASPGSIFLLHLAAVAVGAVAFLGLFPESYRRNPAAALALFIGFCLPLPVVGLVIIACLYGLLRLHPAAHPERHYVLGERQVLTEPPAKDWAFVPRSFGDLFNSPEAELRRTAILGLRAVETKKALPFLQRAVQDGDEQVRLLAQTQLNKILANLEQGIKKLEAELEAPPPDPDRRLRLAEQYHELVFLGLSSEETEAVYLNRAIELLIEAARLAPAKQAIWFLMLKCQLKLRQPQAARASLEKLEALNFQAEFAGPWKAELLFQERNWAELDNALRRLQADPATNPRFLGVVDFWLKPTSFSA